MRILAGHHRGRRLKSPRGTAIRPTLSRIRQALFNILAPRVAGARFLDLYAGTGSIGLEALSRGSREVTLVETDRAAVRVLRENLERLDPEGGRGRLLVLSVHEALGRLHSAGQVFDLIFLDPPYARERESPGREDSRLADLLAPGGLVIWQHGKREQPPDAWSGLEKKRSRTYGETTLSFYAREARHA